MLVDMIGTRLKELRTAADMSQPEFAAIVGTTKQYVSQLEGGKNATPNGTYLEGWARHFGVNHRWLASGVGPKYPLDEPSEDREWPPILGYAQAVGLGSGAEAAEYEETHKLKFRADSLARKGLRPGNLAVVYGKGDSMLPRIRSGDAILFDTSDTNPVDGHLYVIAMEGAANMEYNVKRCEILDEDVFFRADNPAGDHNWRKPRNMHNKRNPIKIIGRVRWIGSWEA
jgi:phage repressor protein C with HTH and peptisase S24 domain